MATKSNIYKDPRWLSLVEKYKDNWVLAAKELFDIDLSHQQQQIVELYSPIMQKLLSPLRMGSDDRKCLLLLVPFIRLCILIPGQ